MHAEIASIYTNVFSDTTLILNIFFVKAAVSRPYLKARGVAKNQIRCSQFILALRRASSSTKFWPADSLASF